MASTTYQASAASHSVAVSRTGARAVVEGGVLAGLVGATTVAVWFLVLDFVRGAPFSTPSLLGRVLFTGQTVESAGEISVPMVFAYTGLHGLLFLIAGVALAWMVAQFERNPQLGMVLLLLFVAFEAILMGLEVSVVPRLVGALGTWTVALANLLSAVVMFWYLLRRHPEAIERMREGWNDQS